MKTRLCSEKPTLVATRGRNKKSEMLPQIKIIIVSSQPYPYTTVTCVPKVELISKPTPKHILKLPISRQHLNFEIQILLERGY